MYNVLIADDEYLSREGMCNIIDWNSLGFSIRAFAENGKEALARLSEEHFDLVITDIRMPVIDGLDLISEIRVSSPDTKIIIFSGYGEFSYAQKAIEYGVKGYFVKPVVREKLLQFVKDIKAELDSQASEKKLAKDNHRVLREKFMFDLVNGILTEEELVKKSRAFGIDTSDQGNCVILFQIVDFSDIAQDNAQKAKNVLSGARNAVEDMVEGMKTGYVYEDVEGLLGVLLMEKSVEARHIGIREYIEEIRLRIARKIDRPVIAGVGNTMNRVLHAKLSRKQAYKALERNIITGGNYTVLYSQVHFSKSLALETKWDRHTLLDAVEENDKKKMEAELDRFISEISQEGIPGDVVKAMIYYMVFGLVSLIKKNNANINKVFENEDMDAVIEKHRDTLALKEWLMGLCLKTGDSLSAVLKYSQSKMIGQILQYIDEHFSEELNLKSMAKRFYLNPGYLGQLFVRHTGESFNDYINKKRIAEVKKLLLKKRHTNLEIIEMVGYKNPEYFYRQFRRYEGMAYSEYKSTMEKDPR